MSIKLKLPDLTELRPRIVVVGVGGAGGNAINNMIASGIDGVEFVAANTDAQALSMSSAGNRIQIGAGITEGLGAGSKPEIGAAAAEEAMDEIRSAIEGAHMLFITAGMGGGTGTGAAPVIARAAKELGVLTVAVVSKPFEFEGQRRMRIAEQGAAELAKYVDTMIVIPNQNLFRIANEKTTFIDAFQRADDVLKSGVSCITDLMVKEGLINLDFADVRVVMQNMGTALMGTGEAEGEKRSLRAAEAAITNPLLGEITMRGAKGLLVSITGSQDMTLYEVEEAASRIRREVDPDSNPDINIIVGATFDPELKGRVRVSVVATGIESGFQYEGARRQPEGARRDGLSDRIYAGTQAPEGHAAAQPQPPRHPPQHPPHPQQRSAYGGVSVEPRPAATAAPDPLPGGRGRPPRPAGAPPFEPAPPRSPIKPPRRPLTNEDFPELSGHRPAENERQEAEPQRGGGLFGWMSGRGRGRSADDSGDAVAGGQRDKKSSHGPDGGPVIIERFPDAPHKGGSVEPDTSRGRRGEPGLSGRKAPGPQDDPFEIPGFFKRQGN